jgi:hypothetical protein
MRGMEMGFLFFDNGSQGAIELSAALVGLLLGILYVFDGWRRPLKAGAFKDSYRLVSLMFIVAGAGTTMFGDLRMFSHNTDPERWPVFFCYIGGVLVGGACVMALLVCGFSLWWLYCKKFDHANFPDLPIFPGLMVVTDGVDATAEKWKVAVEAKSKATEPQRNQARGRFLMKYVELVSKGFAITELYRGSGDASRRTQTQVLILEAMSSVVELYCHSEGRGAYAKFYANYMHLRSAVDVDVRNQINFSVGDPDRYNRVLVLEAQTSDKHAIGFMLGVDSEEANALPGASMVALTGESITVDNVEKDLKFGKGLSKELKTEIEEYLLRKEARSFFCFPVSGTASNPRPRRVIVGVSMVECSEPGILGHHPEDRPSLIDLVQPFRLMLAWTHEINV